MGLLLLSLLADCGKSLAPKPPEPKPNAQPGLPASDNPVTMTGINLYLHDTRPTDGAPRKPTLWVQADEFSLMQDDVWAFAKARAVIYGRDDESENITIEANRGEFKEGERAYMSNGVVAHVGTITLDMQDMEWVNEKREARTDNPIHLVDGKTRLDAASARLLPDERMFILTKVKGVIQLKREEP